ncbi:MAG TPA: hypothetical protein VFQ45_09890 [Longimicrobium sp.]|nr:hypothetical protein [Longimicrobium sp.]
MPARARRALLVLALSCAACAPVVREPAEDVRAAAGRDVEVELHSGERILLRSPVVEGDSVVGGWAGTGQARQRIAVALADVARVREVSLAGPVRVDGDELTVMVFISAAILTLLAAFLPPVIFR